MYPPCGPPRTPPRATSSPPRPVTGGDPAPGGLPDGWDGAGLVPRAGTRCPGFGSVPGEVTAAGFPAPCPRVPAATSTGRRHLCRRVPRGVPRSPCPPPAARGKQTNKGSASCRTYPNPPKRACGVGCPSAHPPFRAGGQFGLFKPSRERGYPLARPPLGARLLSLPAPRQPGRAGKLWPRPARLSPGQTRGDTAGRTRGDAAGRARGQRGWERGGQGERGSGAGLSHCHPTGRLRHPAGCRAPPAPTAHPPAPAWSGGRWGWPATGAVWPLAEVRPPQTVPPPAPPPSAQ